MTTNVISAALSINCHGNTKELVELQLGKTCPKAKVVAIPQERWEGSVSHILLIRGDISVFDIENRQISAHIDRTDISI